MGELFTPTDLKRTACTVNGIPLTQFADGTPITIEYDEDVYNTTKGAAGGYAPGRQNDDGGDVTITLMQGSTRDRAVLDQIVRLQESAGLTPATLATISVKDLSTGEHKVAEQCYITTRPTAAWGAEQQPREYVFKSPHIRTLS